MDIASILRNHFNRIPYSIGKFVAKIPFEFRPGIGFFYRGQKVAIEKFEKLSIQEQKAWVFSRLKRMVVYSYNEIPFYKDFYSSQGFSVDSLNCFDDIKRVPIVNKAILQSYDIELRSSSRVKRQLVNTGGSSGKPLSFFISPKQMGNEWAHMHTIWAKLGYFPHMLKNFFLGR